MTNQVHGHEVMQMMLESAHAYTKDSLREAIFQKFGEDTRYFTCSADNMSADELIAFLADRGKFISSEEGFSTDPEKICNH